MMKALLGFLAVVAYLSACAATGHSKPRKYRHGINLPTTRPLNIAHRGSSGVYPEHTVTAYEQAIRDGADLIECDLYPTLDHQLVCLHDAFLSSHTNIKDFPEFADRKTTHLAAEVGIKTDWFSFDFTLAELKKLRVVQKYSFRNQQYNGQFPISTFDEYVAVAKSAGRPVGIYPEIKFPSFVNDKSFLNGTRFEDLLLDSLKKHGYTKSDDPCFVQCFEEDALRYIKNKTDLPLVMLMYLDETYLGRHLNDSKITEWGSLFYGIGVWKDQVARFYTSQNGYKNWINSTTSLVKDATDAGLKVHLYTFRNEDRYLPWDFQDPYMEYAYFMGYDVDGYFTDFPKTFDNFLSTIYRDEPTQCINSSPWIVPNVLFVITSTLLSLAMMPRGLSINT